MTLYANNDGFVRASKATLEKPIIVRIEPTIIPTNHQEQSDSNLDQNDGFHDSYLAGLRAEKANLSNYENFSVKPKPIKKHDWDFFTDYLKRTG